MTLEEAIKHAKDIMKDTSECVDCRMEHKQLTGWLEELLAYRKMDKQGQLLFLADDIGKVLYITREEAEAKLAEMEESHEVE